MKRPPGILKRLPNPPKNHPNLPRNHPDIQTPSESPGSVRFRLPFVPHRTSFSSIRSPSVSQSSTLRAAHCSVSFPTAQLLLLASLAPIVFVGRLAARVTSRKHRSLPVHSSGLVSARTRYCCRVFGATRTCKPVPVAANLRRECYFYRSAPWSRPDDLFTRRVKRFRARFRRVNSFCSRWGFEDCNLANRVEFLCFRKLRLSARFRFKELWKFRV